MKYMVRKQASPPISCETASAANTPVVPMPHKAYEDKGPVLYVTGMSPAVKPKQEVLTF